MGHLLGGASAAGLTGFCKCTCFEVKYVYGVAYRLLNVQHNNLTPRDEKGPLVRPPYENLPPTIPRAF